MKAIMTKYLGPTNTLGARIKAYDMDGNFVIVTYDHGAREPHLEAIRAFLKKYKWGWNVVIRSGCRGFNCWINADNSADKFRLWEV